MIPCRENAHALPGSRPAVEHLFTGWVPIGPFTITAAAPLPAVVVSGAGYVTGRIDPVCPLPPPRGPHFRRVAQWKSRRYRDGRQTFPGPPGRWFNPSGAFSSVEERNPMSQKKKGRKKINLAPELLKAAHDALLSGTSWASESARLGVAVGTLKARLAEAGLGVEVRKMAVGGAP